MSLRSDRKVTKSHWNREITQRWSQVSSEPCPGFRPSLDGAVLSKAVTVKGVDGVAIACLLTENQSSARQVKRAHLCKHTGGRSEGSPHRLPGGRAFQCAQLQLSLTQKSCGLWRDSEHVKTPINKGTREMKSLQRRSDRRLAKDTTSDTVPIAFSCPGWPLWGSEWESRFNWCGFQSLAWCWRKWGVCVMCVY